MHFYQGYITLLLSRHWTNGHIKEPQYLLTEINAYVNELVPPMLKGKDDNFCETS